MTAAGSRKPPPPARGPWYSRDARAGRRTRRRPGSRSARRRRHARDGVVSTTPGYNERWRRTVIRILVVDDHALVRRGLIELLQGLPAGVQFGEAGTAAEAITLAFGERWDVVLLDLGLPDRHGLEVLREVHAARPKLPVL